MIRKTMATLFILALAVTVLADDVVSETFDKTFPLSTGGRVSLDNINGDVTVEVWDRDEVRVQAEKQASTWEILEGLQVQVDVSPSRIAIETDYPNSNSFSRRHGTRMTVDYTLTVPRASKIDTIDLINGSILITGVEGGVQAESINGRIETHRVAGAIHLSTVNGKIRPSFETLTGVRSIDLETVNGSVEVKLDGSTGVSLDVETVNGRIANDFGVQVHKHKYVGADMRGDIAGGGIPLTIETVNGSVEVLQH